jgi:hypothetical protein
LTGIASTLSSAAEAHPAALKTPALRRVSGWTVAALVTLVPAAFVYARPIRTAPNYDEEVYLATMRELHHGLAIGPVFLSQPPGFGWLLDAIGATTSSLPDVRAVMIGFSLFGCVAAWTLGRRIAGPLGGAISAGALLIAPSWVAMSTRLEAEVPSTSLAVCALALAEPFPLAAGATFALAVSMKLYAVSAIVPLVLIARRRLGALALGCVLGALAVVLSVTPHLADVWHDAFLFHLHERGQAGPVDQNVHRVVHFFDTRTPFAVVAAVAIGTAIVALLRRGQWPVVWALWTWPPAAALVLIVERPIFDHSLEILAAAWALPIGVTLAAATANTRGRARLAVGAATVVTVAGALVQQWSHLGPVAPNPDVQAAVQRLRALYPPGTLVASDHQIVPYLAGDREPPRLVDLSAARLAGGLPRPLLLRDARGAKAFVVGRALADDAPVLAALERRYRLRIVLSSITIYADPR